MYEVVFCVFKIESVLKARKDGNLFVMDRGQIKYFIFCNFRIESTELSGFVFPEHELKICGREMGKKTLNQSTENNK